MHKTEPLAISVIVPVYNVERYLPMCLESIVQQQLADYEVILVDDGSTDGSAAICDEFAEQYPEFRVIHKGNGGVAAARNRGIEEAKGEYILFLDSDDFLVPDTIKPLLELAQDNDLDVLGFSYLTVPEETTSAPEVSFRTPQKIEILNGYDYIARFNYTAQVWWYLVRRELLIKNNLLLPVGHVLEEAAFNMLLFLKAERIAQAPNVAYCYRNRPSSIMHNADEEHVSKMLDDYIFAASSMNEAIEEYRDKLHGECYERCRTRRDSYVLFGAIRAFKLGKVKEYLQKAKEQEFYPIKGLSEVDYPGFKFKLLHWFVSKPWLWNALSKIYKIVK